METPAVNQNRGKFTDEQLREDIRLGLRPVDIARKHGVSKAAVSKRVNRLQLTTIVAAGRPAESKQFVARSIDAIGQLVKSLGKVNLLMDACDDWLRDVDDPERYDIGPRAGDIDVIYQVEVVTQTGYRTERRKKKLAELLSDLEGVDSDGARFVRAEKGEYKHADPRELILKTAQEARSTVSTAADLARMLSDAQAMQEWRRVVLDAVERAAPDVRDAIEREVRSSLVLRGLLDGPGATWSEVN